MTDVARAGAGRVDPDRPELGPLFRYIWRNSRREQIVILVVVLASLPFYFLSLDLPKQIVNSAIQGGAFKHGRETAALFVFDISLPQMLGGTTWSFPGIEFGRYEYLFVLSGLFMILVLINGAFRYVVNMRKGKLGERLLRRLRLDLFSLLLLFTPEAMRSVKPSEIATIIKDEVEPIGGFVGDAFVAPAFLGGQAITALAFILVQSPSLGVIAAFMVGVQGIIIPRLRREQIRLGQERQLRSRALAGHIGEIVDGKAEVENHGTSIYERHKIAGLLDQLFWIRYDLYGRKFMVKFINSILAQVTPFLFYSIGGYYALRGTLDIGQLVAVISAYRELPPPVKELIDWDQQRMDVDVKYQQIVQQFSSTRPADGGVDDAGLPEPLSGSIDLQGVRVRGAAGEAILDGVTTSVPLGQHTALVAESGEAAVLVAQVIGRRVAAYEGSVRLAGRELSSLRETTIGPVMAYFGPDATLFQGTIRDNVAYSLMRPATGAVLPSLETVGGETSRRNPAADLVWTDYAAAGAAGPDDLDDAIITVLAELGAAEGVFRLGLNRRLDPATHRDLAQRVVDARAVLQRLVVEHHLDALVEPFDPERFNRNATIGENLFFGVARSADARDENLVSDPEVLVLLDRLGLRTPLCEVGLRIAATMVEIFVDVATDNFLFERFSFLSAEELPAFAEIVQRAARGGQAALSPAERSRLIGLAMAYGEPLHRLGLITPDLAQRIVAARTTIRQGLPARLADTIEFYDPARFCAAAPLRDNLLFGRIDQTVAGAEERVSATLHVVVRECNLEREIFRFGLDHQSGPGGRLLAPTQRSAIALARCLVKRPRILVVEQLLSIFGDIEGRAILARLRERMAGGTLIVSTRDPAMAAGFDLALAFRGSRLHATESMTGPADVSVIVPDAEQPEVQALRAVPMFATIDTGRLKLIAFTSDRLTFAAGQTLFRQGDPSDAAYVVLSGTVDVFLDTPSGRLHLSNLGEHAVVGEMGVVSGSGRSATVVAATDLMTIRLSKDVFMGLLTEFPQIALAVMRDQIRRIITTDAKLVATPPDQVPGA